MLYGFFMAVVELYRDNHTVSVGYTSQLIYSLWVSGRPAERDSGLWLESGLLHGFPSSPDQQDTRVCSFLGVASLCICPTGQSQFNGQT